MVSGRAGRMLVALGPQAAPAVLAKMNLDEVTEALARVAETVPDAALDYLDPGVEVTTWMATQRALGKEGPRQARQVAQRIQGPFAGEETLDEIDQLWEHPLGNVDEEEVESERASGRLAEALRDVETPGAALALCLAPRPLARRTLVDLMEAGREDVPLWIASIDSAYPHTVEDPEQGEEILSELLDGLRAEVRDRVLEAVKRQDDQLWGRLYDRGFTIRELEGLDDIQLGELLSRSPADDLALALREAPQQLRHRCMQCMPRGLRSQVNQALDRDQPVRLRCLERARKRLGATCRDLGLRGDSRAFV